MNVRAFIPLILAVLVLIASIGLYAGGYYLLNRLTDTAASLASQATLANQQLENATRAHSALTSGAAGQNVNQYLVTKNDIVPFLESLQAVGTPLGSSVSVVSVTDQSDKLHSRIALSLSITGSFDAVMRTLGGIEYAPYDGVMTSVSMDSAAASSGAGWTALASYSVGVRSASSTKP